MAQWYLPFKYIFTHTPPVVGVASIFFQLEFNISVRNTKLAILATLGCRLPHLFLIRPFLSLLRSDIGLDSLLLYPFYTECGVLFQKPWKLLWAPQISHQLIIHLCSSFMCSPWFFFFVSGWWWLGDWFLHFVFSGLKMEADFCILKGTDQL